MGTWNPFPDVSARKPLFTAVYVTVLAGILFSTLFIVSSLYSSAAIGSSNNSFNSVGSRLSPSSSAPPSSADATSLQTEFTSVDNPIDAAMAGEDFRTRDIWEMPPPNVKVPDLAFFRLTKEMVGYRAKDNVIIVTFGNYAFMDFILNWVKHLTDLNIFNLLVQWIPSYW